MDINIVEQYAIDITRLTNSRDVVACIGVNDQGNYVQLTPKYKITCIYIHGY